MKCFHTLYRLLDEATSQETPGFTVKTVQLQHTTGYCIGTFSQSVISVNKYSEDACTEDVGWACV